MVTEEERQYILTRAYVPEHVVGLMTRVSEAEPFLMDGYFCCRGPDRLIVVGYPLDRAFDEHSFRKSLEGLLDKFRPPRISLIVPRALHSVPGTLVDRQSDHYFTLKPEYDNLSSRLKRIAHTALKSLRIQRAFHMDRSHAQLTREFIDRVNPPRRVRELFLKMPDYAGKDRESMVLNALDQSGNLTAFYVLDCAAADFSTYVIGCHSKINYVKGASDALFYEMIRVSSEMNKKYLHLGLGVNKGIAQFKKKWGGSPTRGYEMYELETRKSSFLTAMMNYFRAR